MAIQKLTLRKYKESDIDNIEKLQLTQFEPGGVHNRALIFDWIAGHNPASEDGTGYLVIDDGEKIAAYEGRMPVDLLVNGVKERGYFFHDTLVHPEYRKKGLGLKLVNQLKTAWEDATNTFAIGIWMNQFTHEILKRRGYYELNAAYYVRPLNFLPFISKVTGNRFLLRIVSPLFSGIFGMYDRVFSLRRYPDISVIRISRFDRKFDDFAERVTAKFELIALRHSRYLNWKYVDKPFADYTILACQKNNEPAGFVVLTALKTDNIKVGVIVDILADPDDSRVISSLCQQAIDYFYKQKADFVSCVLTSPEFISIFKRHLFFKRRKTAPVMVGNLSKHHEQDILKDINRWFLTYGDSDGFVWQ